MKFPFWQIMGVYVLGCVAGLIVGFGLGATHPYNQKRPTCPQVVFASEPGVYVCVAANTWTIEKQK